MKIGLELTEQSGKIFHHGSCESDYSACRTLGSKNCAGARRTLLQFVWGMADAGTIVRMGRMRVQTVNSSVGTGRV